MYLVFLFCVSLYNILRLGYDKRSFKLNKGEINLVLTGSMDVSITSDSQMSTLVRITQIIANSFLHIFQYKCLNLCFCQMAMFAPASWCPLSCPLSLFPISPSWLLTRLSLHLPLLLLPLSILMLCVAAARLLVLSHSLTAFGPACHSLDLVSLHGQDKPSNLHHAGLDSQARPAGPGHKQFQSLSLHLFQFQPRLKP